MIVQHHTPDGGTTESLPLRKPLPLYLCQAGQPTSSLAEWVVLDWMDGLQERPWALIHVGQADLAALTEALRTRLERIQLDGEAGDRALTHGLRAAIDRGACLIAGDGLERPALLRNLICSSNLLADLEGPGCGLALACAEENPGLLEGRFGPITVLTFPEASKEEST